MLVRGVVLKSLRTIGSLASRLLPLPSEVTVAFLMDDVSKTWDVDRVNAFFEEEVASAIFQVPISRHGGEDFASWPHDKLGQYLVIFPSCT